MASLPMERSIATPSDNALRRELAEYSIHPEIYDEVADFLKEYPFLLPVLQRTKNEILRRFREHISLRLHVHIDPEVEDDRMLWLTIWSEEPMESVNKRFRAFEREWWLAEGRKTEDLMAVDRMGRLTNEF